MDLNKYILSIPDFPKKGIIFYDITPLMANPEAYEYTISRLAKMIAETKPTKILAAESRGFFFGPAIAIKLRLPFIPIRKCGKLPRETLEVGYSLEYGQDKLCVHKADIGEGDRLAIIDDILATGGTARAMCQMAELSKAEIACCAFFMEIGVLNGREKLGESPVISMFVK